MLKASKVMFWATSGVPKDTNTRDNPFPRIFCILAVWSFVVQSLPTSIDV